MISELFELSWGARLIIYMVSMVCLFVIVAVGRYLATRPSPILRVLATVVTMAPIYGVLYLLHIELPPSTKLVADMMIVLMALLHLLTIRMTLDNRMSAMYLALEERDRP